MEVANEQRKQTHKTRLPFDWGRWKHIPSCRDIGENLKRNGLSEEASEMTNKVFASGSYEKALGIIGDYVNITSVDEPDEGFGMEMR